MQFVKQLSLDLQDLNPFITSLNLSFNDREALRTEILDFHKSVKSNPSNIFAYNSFASALFSKGKHQEAIKAYRQALQIDPRNLKTYCNLAHTYHCINPDSTEAITLLNKALELDPKNPTINSLLCVVNFSQGNLDLAIKYGSQAIQLGASDISLVIKVGRAYLAQRNVEGAFQYMHQAIEMDPKSSAARLYLGEAFYQCENFEPALENLKLAVELDSQNIEAYSLLGLIYCEQKEYKEAKKCFNTVIELDKKNSNALYHLGHIAYQENETTIALGYFGRANFLNFPDIDTLNYLGMILMEEKKIEAIQVYAKLIEYEPQNAMNFFNLGLAYYHRGDLDKAMDQFIQAKLLNPEHAETHYNMGIVLAAKGGKAEGVIYHFNAAIEVNPKYAEAYNSLATIYADQSNYEKALENYNKAIEIEPECDLYWNNRGRALYLQGKQEEALEDFRQAIKLNGENYFAYSNIGSYYHEKKEVEEAIKNFDKAIELNGNDVVTYCKRAQAYYELNKNNEALEDFNIAYDMFSKGDFGRRNLHLSGENKEFVDKALKGVRTELLAKLAEVKEVTSDFDEFLDDIGPRRATVKHEIEAYNKLKMSTMGMAETLSDKIRAQSLQNSTSGTVLYEDPEKLMKEMQQMKELFPMIIKKLREHDDTLKAGGIYDKVAVKEQFEGFRAKDPELYKYCKAFYWTLLNYLSAYRALGSNLITGNLKSDQSSKEKIYELAIRKTVSASKMILKGIPFVGAGLSMIDAMIDPVLVLVKKKKFNQKVNIINEVLAFSGDSSVLTDEDISIMCGKTAINITKAKSEEILEAATGGNEDQEVSQYLNFKSKMKQLKDCVLPSIGLKGGPVATMALRDVAYLLTFICCSHEEVLASKKPLFEQFTAVIVEEKWRDIEMKLAVSKSDSSGDLADVLSSKGLGADGLMVPNDKCNIF